ncbi:MAG: hypothetical protein LWX54_08775, partial [Deltaproteobacteria bacterium]|nr:hypothetical protein [Deltaproteobacteria bacterium]
MKKAILGSFLFVIICSAVPALAAEGFTKKDREILIELKVKMGEIDNRFEQVDLSGHPCGSLWQYSYCGFWFRIL